MSAVTIKTGQQTLTVQVLHGGHWGPGTVINNDDASLGRPAHKLTETEVENLQAYWHAMGKIESGVWE